MRLFLRLLLAVVLVLPVLLLVAALASIESRPLIAEPVSPSPSDVADARRLVHQIRFATNGETPQPAEIEIAPDTMDAVARMGARMFPGLRSDASIEESRLVLRAALPFRPPRAQRDIWLNAEMVIPDFEDGLVIEKLRVGHLSLPPSVARAVLLRGADLVLGDGTSARLLAGVPELRVADDTVVARLDMDSRTRGTFAADAFSALRGERMPSAERIATEYRAIRDAIESGALPDHGSVLPHLRFVLERAARETDPAARNLAYTAGIFGLTDACGAKDFAMIADRLIEGTAEPDATWSRDCDDVSLSGRVDTKRHFITSAALQAASNRGVAVSIGEFKELYDIRESGGFDFTDMAADLAGVRLSDTVMSDLSSGDILGRIRSEADIMVVLDDIPGRMKGEAFQARYGDLDSPAYRDEIARIENRIDALPLHADR